MKNVLISCGIVLALSAPSSMLADTLFNFSYTAYQVHGQPGEWFGASGQLDTISTSTDEVFSIVGISGSLSGYTLNGVVITGLDEQDGQQGTVTVSNGTLSLDGLAFLFNYGVGTLDAGSYPPFFTVNTGYLATIGEDPTKGPFIDEVGAPVVSITEASPVPSATPEPSTLVLLTTGALGLLGAMRRRLR